MKFYENECGFHRLEENEDLPLNSLLYEISFNTSSLQKRCHRSEFFPQFQLKISSEPVAYYGTNKLTFIYKKRYRFSHSGPNNYLYLLRMLNELKNSDLEYEKILLKYMKADLDNKKYFEYKDELDELNSIEKLQQSNSTLLQKINDTKSIENNVKIISEKVNLIQLRVDKIEKNINNKKCNWRFWKN
ncbi:hypothetical protein [Lutimonas vermicola]|uniref:Uncharacterized protein n=1 Tax=Lutimonas vermicola TaxID=414288 RepID=A0ABU9L4L4_9FLAO